MATGECRENKDKDIFNNLIIDSIFLYLCSVKLKI